MLRVVSFDFPIEKCVYTICHRLPDPTVAIYRSICLPLLSPINLVFVWYSCSYYINIIIATTIISFMQSRLSHVSLCLQKFEPIFFCRYLTSLFHPSFHSFRLRKYMILVRKCFEFNVKKLTAEIKYQGKYLYENIHSFRLRKYMILVRKCFALNVKKLTAEIKYHGNYFH